MGPYLLERRWRSWWGNELSWWRLPSIGSFGGDGGGFLFLLGLRIDLVMKRKRKRNRDDMIAANMKDWIWISSIFLHEELISMCFWRGTVYLYIYL